MSEPPKTTPSPPPRPERHVAMSTNMEVMSCTLGFFFLCAILCAAFRLLYLKRIESRRRTGPNRPVQFNFSGSDREPAVDHPVWLINFVGLSQSAIDSIGTCRYKKEEGLIEATECSVCLGEFEEDEDVRLLPKCVHAFHAPCIDTWLRSHKNCPLCRAPVVVVVGNVGDAVRMETVVEVSEVESESEVENRVDEGGSGDEIDMGFGDVMLIEGGIGRNSKNCDSWSLDSERELDRRNGEGGSGDVTLVDVEIGGNSKNCDFREIRGLDIERELDRHDRVGEGGSGAEIDMDYGDVTLVDVEIGGNLKNCDFREFRGLNIERELDLHNRVGEGCDGVEIDMSFSGVTFIDRGRNLKICDYREIRDLGIKRELDHRNRVGEGGSGAKIDMGFGDVTQIDDEIGRNWKICDYRGIGDSADKKMDPDYQNRVAGDGSGGEIDLIFCSNAQIDDKIGKKSKILNSRALGDLGGIEPMKRSLSMGSNSSKLGRLKRHSFKKNGDGNESSGFFRLIRSASSGRLSNLSNISMMKRCNSGSWGNFRSQDSILPI